MNIKNQVMVIHEKDNVAIALEPLGKGATVPVRFWGKMMKVQIQSDIPLGHKFALMNMDEGEAVIKYGEPIGQSMSKISRGEHVHVHNVMSYPREG